MNKIFDQEFLEGLLKQAKESPRLRQNYDLRNSSEDTSQRMLNALQPGTQVPIHKHETTAETVVCLCGKLEEIIYEEVIEYIKDNDAKSFDGGDVMRKVSYRETGRYLLSPTEGNHGMQIPPNTWHSINVIEPSIIFEAKDGKYLG
ncbi:MAG: WbuC family cupin fold metalloprotein [Bacteroidales bacterium]|nr:WbuC family cupin fold metalloprotein [Bacteroidales bacterium]